MKENRYDQFFKSARNKKKRKQVSLKTRQVTSKGRKISKEKHRRRGHHPVIGLVVFLIVVIVSLNYYQEIEDFAARVEVSIFGRANARDVVLNNSENISSKKEPPAETKVSERREDQLLRRGWTSEEIALFNKLDSRRIELDEKERRLDELEGELQVKQIELDKRLTELEKIRKGISNQLEEKVKHDQERINKLVEFYSNMKPQNAAKVLSELDEDLAIEVLANMKKKNAADILNLIESAKAQRLSEKFAGYRKK